MIPHPSAQCKRKSALVERALPFPINLRRVAVDAISTRLAADRFRLGPRPWIYLILHNSEYVGIVRIAISRVTQDAMQGRKAVH